MKALILIILLTAATAHADCRGCCSGKGGVECIDGVTMCADGTALSDTCLEKACEKCEDAPEAPGYDRDSFGGWADLDGDCQDTRDEILIRDGADIVFDGCDVESGTWVCPYTGKTFTIPGDLDIDHIVPLKEAYLSGAHRWTLKEKECFANDPLNLIACEDNTNQSKGSRDPAKWMPEKNRAWYKTRWREIKEKYGLRMDAAERAALKLP